MRNIFKFDLSNSIAVVKKIQVTSRCLLVLTNNVYVMWVKHFSFSIFVTYLNLQYLHAYDHIPAAKTSFRFVIYNQKNFCFKY